MCKKVRTVKSSKIYREGAREKAAAATPNFHHLLEYVEMIINKPSKMIIENNSRYLRYYSHLFLNIASIIKNNALQEKKTVSPFSCLMCICTPMVKCQLLEIDLNSFT